MGSDSDIKLNKVFGQLLIIILISELQTSAIFECITDFKISLEKGLKKSENTKTVSFPLTICLHLKIRT